MAASLIDTESKGPLAGLTRLRTPRKPVWSGNDDEDDTMWMLGAPTSGQAFQMPLSYVKLLDVGTKLRKSKLALLALEALLSLAAAW